MIDLDELCAELNEALPAAGWPLRRHPLIPFTHSTSRYAAAIWGPGPGERDGDAIAPEIGLQLYQRENNPVLIVFETHLSCGTVYPNRFNAVSIIAALNEFRWVIEQ